MIGLCKAAKIYDESKGKFSTVAYHCVLNEIKRELRRRMKHPQDILSLDYELYGDDNSVTTFGERLVGEDDVDYVDYDAICERLSKRELIVFKMAKDGASMKEIATALNVCHETARKHLRKVKSIIKREVNDYVDEV
jgi:RNA polymerase sporulation-specific sigma factor